MLHHGHHNFDGRTGLLVLVVLLLEFGVLLTVSLVMWIHAKAKER